MTPRALITGITGQDGYYLTRLLLERGYQVFGTIRRASTHPADDLPRQFEELFPAAPPVELLHADLNDSSALNRLLRAVRPAEIYNLGAQSHVHDSFQNPEYTADINGLGALRLLEAIRAAEIPCKYFQASSAELFGEPRVSPQDETTPFHPRSPYGTAKLLAFWAAVNYREAHGLFACNGILYNHESPRRGESFVTRKITAAVARIAHGRQQQLLLGNLDARRDWSFAGDTVEAIWLMLQQPQPGDFVIASGETHSVREFVEAAFHVVGLDWERYVEQDPALYRPAESVQLTGNSSYARRVLNWRPRVGFEELVRMMVEHDLQLVEREAGVG